MNVRALLVRPAGESRVRSSFVVICINIFRRRRKFTTRRKAAIINPLKGKDVNWLHLAIQV